MLKVLARHDGPQQCCPVFCSNAINRVLVLARPGISLRPPLSYSAPPAGDEEQGRNCSHGFYQLRVLLSFALTGLAAMTAAHFNPTLQVALDHTALCYQAIVAHSTQSSSKHRRSAGPSRGCAPVVAAVCVLAVHRDKWRREPRVLTFP